MVTTHIHLCLHIVYTHPLPVVNVCKQHHVAYTTFDSLLSSPRYSSLTGQHSVHYQIMWTTNEVWNINIEGSINLRDKTLAINQLFAKFTNAFPCLLYSNFILTMMGTWSTVKWHQTQYHILLLIYKWNYYWQKKNFTNRLLASK